MSSNRTPCSPSLGLSVDTLGSSSKQRVKKRPNEEKNFNILGHFLSNIYPPTTQTPKKFTK